MKEKKSCKITTIKDAMQLNRMKDAQSPSQYLQLGQLVAEGVVRRRRRYWRRAGGNGDPLCIQQPQLDLHVKEDFQIC